VTALEEPGVPATSLRRAFADSGRLYLANALVGFVLPTTAPIAIILAIGTRGGLTPAEMSSWLFATFFLNGLITLYFCWRFRQPLVFLWSIPGTVLVGQALSHASFPEVIGAFVGTGVLILVLGLSGWVRRVTEAVPMPIVMGMVAGVFLRFGVDLVYAIRDDFRIAASMTVSYVALAAAPRLGRLIPPVIGATVVGGLAIGLLGRFAPESLQGVGFADPNLYAPRFSLQTMLELVVPLAITVLAVQNGQGIAVLRAAGHRTPINAVTVACGVGSLATALFGAVSTCLAGPVNAVISASGERQRQYTAGLMIGVLSLAAGLAAPTFVGLMLATPMTFVGALAGLAMVRVLQGAFVAAFRERFTLGAMVTFVFTVADVPILTIGAPFWGLVFGFVASWLLEREDFGAART